MTIREARLSDAQELLALAIKIFRDTFTHNNTPEAMEGFIAADYTLEKFEKELQDPNAQTFLVCDNDEAIGYLRIRRNSEVDHLLGTNHTEIQRLYIDHAYHGQKVADKLMQFALDIANQRSNEWVWLGVWEFNPRARRFYEKWGFEKFSEHDFYMGAERQTDWLMKKKLT